MIACAPAPPPATATVGALRLSEEDAGRLAIAVVSEGGPEMQPPLEEPRVHSLKQLTWRQTQERYGRELPEIPAPLWYMYALLPRRPTTLAPPVPAMKLSRTAPTSFPLRTFRRHAPSCPGSLKAVINRPDAQCNRSATSRGGRERA